jgi:hypothetical protein
MAAMKKRLAIVTIIVVAIATGAAMTLFVWREATFRAKYDRIQPGMISEEVAGIIGPATFAYPVRPSRPFTYTFAWSSGWTWIQVEFDGNRRVCHKEMFN